VETIGSKRSYALIWCMPNNDDDDESYLESMQQEFCLTGIKKLFDKCNICIGVKGDYVDKIT